MERNILRIGLINWLMLLVAAGVGGAVARYAGSATGEAGMIFLALGFLVAAVSYFQMRLENRERVEALEVDELKRTRGGATLFDQESDSFPAKRSREQFERFLVPAFTVLLFALQIAAAVWLWQRHQIPDLPDPSRAGLAMALFGLMSLVLFMLGKYSSGLARLDEQRLLRPASGYLLLGALICFLVALTEAAGWFRIPKADYYVVKALTIVLGLAAVETLLGLIFEIYRPRARRGPSRMLYESRLIGLLGQPGGLITTAAQALDYQFGFKVSETWVYRFLEKAFAWIVLLQLGVLFLSTGLVIVEPHEQAILERFGRPVADREVLEPGLHFKFPWPIDKVYRHPTRAIQSFNIGFVPAERAEGEPEERTILWTRQHYKEEFKLLVASREQETLENNGPDNGERAVPVNLITVSIPVQYQVTNLVSWTYEHSDAAGLLEDLATREVVRYLVSVDFDDILTRGRLDAAKKLQTLIQDRANEYKIGADIVFVGLQDIHPPVEVASAFEEVIGAIQEKESKILGAQGERAEIVPKARADAARLINEAEAARLEKTSSSAARAGQFTNQVAAYMAAPRVFMRRTYLDTLARATADARKYVLAVTNSSEVFMMNLEEKIAPDMLDVPIGVGGPGEQAGE